MKQALAALIALLLAGCVAVHEPDVAERDGTPVALGQRAHVGAYVVRPISVYEDSRCPSGVRCIWAGRLIVYVLIDGPGLHDLRYLTLDVPSSIGDSSVVLSAVTPERFAQVPLHLSDYRFVFTRGS